LAYSLHERIDAYIEKHKLKKPKSDFVIYPDAKLGKVLGTEPISTFLTSRPVNKHLTRRR
jgi:chromatin remodeling complex protein RSC6